MANTIKLGLNQNSGKTPTNLQEGEIAINSANRKIWVGTDGTTAGQVLVFDHSIYSTDLTDNNDNYYLNGITKSGNKLTFSVSGATNQEYTFGSNAFTSTTIPTNTNQLTNGAGFVTNSGVTGISTSAGLDGSGTSGTVNVSLDLSELTDMTADVVGANDELILLDSGAERRKAINEIKLSQFNNDAGFITDGNTGWNNSYGFVTSSGVTQINTGAGLDGGSSSSTVSLSLDLSELTDMTDSWSNSTDEFIVLDNGTQKRKLSSEIFGSNAFNSTTIPTNTNQLTNGAGFTTAAGHNHDSRYYTESEVNTLLAGKSSTSHNHNSTYLALTGGTLNSGGNDTTLAIQCKNAGRAMLQLGDSTDGSQGTGVLELTQDGSYGAGLSYNGDNNPTFATGESSDNMTFYRLNNGSRDEVFSYPYNSNTVTFNGALVWSGGGSANANTAYGWGNHASAGYSTASNSQTFTNKGGNISQWTNDSGYTTNVGDITNVSVGTGLDGGGSSGSVTINLDLSELPDMTQSWANGSDEFIVLDGGTQKRKLSSEIFGSNAFNSTTIPTNTNQLTNGAGFITDGNTGWNNTYGFVTSSGVTSVASGTGITGGTITGTGTLSLALGELPDMTEGWTNSVDEFVVLNNGSQARKRSAEIFGSNAFNSTTIPTNNNQLTNGAGYTTNVGDITNVSVGTGLDGGGSSGSVTINLDLSELADMTQSWTNGSDEFIVLDGGVQKRKLSSEIFGSNAFNSTTIPTNTNQLTNGAGFTTAGGHNHDSRYYTEGEVDTLISGFVTSSGVTSVSVGTGLDGGGSSSSVSVSLDLSELADMTQSWSNSSDEFIVLDSGTQKRKLSSEIFGSNAFNSTTIPTNNNQLTNGAGYRTSAQVDTAIGDYAGTIAATGASALFGGGSSGVTNKGISQDIGYKLMNGTMSVGCVTTSGGTTNEYLRYGSGGTFTWDTIQFSHLQNLSALTALP